MEKKNIDELRKNGIIKIPNFLDTHTLKKFKSFILKEKPAKGTSNSYISKSYRELTYKLLKLDLIKFQSHFFVLKFAKKKKLKNFSQLYFGKKSYLSMIDGYYNDQKKFDNKTIIPWHTDMAHGGQTDVSKIKEFPNPLDVSLKFFIYLSDVYKDNGCMSYVPSSHRITFQIRKGIYENKIDYSPYCNLSEIKSFLKIKKNYNYVAQNLDNSEDLDIFLNKVDNLDDLKGFDDYDYNMRAGDAIIFDEGIVHRGSRLLYTDRIVLRYIYRPYL